MFESLRRHWHAFLADPPGQRFQIRHARHRARYRSAGHKAFVIGVGTVAIMVGIVLLVLPGPGLLMILLGAGLVGEESLAVSRLLDRIDLWRSRRLTRRRDAA
jgi:hypothetical protein